MSYFSDTIAAQLAGQVVTVGTLVFFDFKTTPVRVWDGYDDLATAGQTWLGRGTFGSVDGLERPFNGSAPVATFTLSGVEPGLLADALASSDEVKGRDVTVFVQFFDQDRHMLDNPYAIYTGVMDVMSVTLAGVGKATISLTAESIFARRGSAMWSNFSDRDQKRLYPDDRGLEQVAQMPFKSEPWPIITVKS